MVQTKELLTRGGLGARRDASRSSCRKAYRCCAFSTTCAAIRCGLVFVSDEYGDQGLVTAADLLEAIAGDGALLA